MIRSSISMGRNFYIRYRNVPKEQVLSERKKKYNNGVGNGIKMNRCAGMKISITLKKSSFYQKTFASFPIFFFILTRWLFPSHSLPSPHKNGKRMYSCAQIQSFFFSSIGEKRSYDRINCLLKTRFNIDNWMAYRLTTMSTIYLYIFEKFSNIWPFYLFVHFQCWKKGHVKVFVFLTLFFSILKIINQIKTNSMCSY